MSTLLSRALVVMRSLSLKTHLYSLCVIAGTLLLCLGFFKEPNIGFSTTTTSVVKDMEKVSSSKLTLTVEVQSLSLNSDNSEDTISMKQLSIEDAEPAYDNNSYESRGLTLDEYTTLAKIVEAEAGTEDITGMTLIADVINNRVESRFFPNDIVSVIMQPGQFDPVDNGYIYRVEPSHEAKQAVMNAFMEGDHSNGALYFQKSPSTVWGNKSYLFRHGAHSFYGI